jgi:hypothetical protein
MGGTKAIVEKYHDTMARALNFICDSQLDEEEVRARAHISTDRHIKRALNNLICDAYPQLK